MHEFKYRNGELYCEQVNVRGIAQEFGTPLYIYSRRTLIDHYEKITRAFRTVQPLVCFSMKANSNLAILKILSDCGAGMDVVSGGELYKALRAGVQSQKIVYAGVGKSRREISEAIKAGILFFNAESIPEVALIDQVAGQLKRKVDVSLRINPDVQAHTHKYITTGKISSKFGLDMQTAEDIFLRSQIFAHLQLTGVHIHIGSQITEYTPYLQAIQKMLSFITQLQKKNVALQYFNIGGGMGIVYHDERPQSAEKLARAILPLLKKSGLKIVLEPGRFIAGNSGIMVTRIVYVKKTAQKNFAIVDAGMNDLIRPALYNAYHEIVPLNAAGKDKKTYKYDIVGPICESGDFFAKNRSMPELYAQDLLAVMGAGAYGFTMSSNYNSRPRAAEVLVDQDKCYLIRKRETYRDLISKEIVPQWEN